MKDTKYNLKLTEYKTWYSGEADEIRDFYRTQGSKLLSKQGSNATRGYFWSIVPQNITEETVKIHTGIPRLISKKMADILLVNGFNITIEDDDDNEKEYRLQEILKANSFRTKLALLLETNSWSGGTALKITIDPLFNEPLIEVISPENYEPIIYKNRIIADKFIVPLEDENGKQYELQEIYGVDKDKGSYIKYKLYGIDKGDKEELPLATLEDTKDLKDTYISGLQKKLSYYIPNRLPNSDYKSSVLGESDYAGSGGLYNSLDEIYSTYMQEFRDSKLNRYFPSNYLMLDPESGEYKRENAMKTNHILYSTGISEDIQGKIMYEQGDLRTEKHEQAFRQTLMQICNLAGLSPLTLGITGLESIAASAESQQEREKVTIRTRETKAEILEEALEHFLEALLIADDILNSADGNTATTKEYAVNFAFNDYMVKSKADKIAEMEVALQSGTIDRLNAIKYIYDDLSFADQVEILIMSKIEGGLTTFTAKEQEWYNALMEGKPIDEE